MSDQAGVRLAGSPNRCAAHPGAASTAPCPRCGDFVCPACLSPVAGAVCRACAARAGGVLWPAGRELSVPKLLGVALGQLPRHVPAALIIFGLFLPMQWASLSVLKAQAAGKPVALPQIVDVALLQLGGFLFLGVIGPFVCVATAVRVIQDLTGRPPRGLWENGLPLVLRAIGLEVAAFVALVAFGCPLIFGVVLVAFTGALGPFPPVPGQPPSTPFLIVTVVATAIGLLPVTALWWLAQSSLAAEGGGVAGAIRRAVEFVRAHIATSLGVLFLQFIVTVTSIAGGQVFQAMLKQAPALAEPLAVIQAFLAGAMIVFWAVFFAVLWAGRAATS